MPIDVALFAEDDGHRLLLSSLLARWSREEGADVRIKERHAGGGIGAALSELKRYVRDVAAGRESFSEVLVVAIDTNCQGFAERSRQVRRIVDGVYAGHLVLALPDPHVERWYLADRYAVAHVLGDNFAAEVPQQKCLRGRYKQALREAFLQGDVDPPAGGIEYGDDIAEAMDFSSVEGCSELLTFRADFLGALRVLTGGT